MECFQRHPAPPLAVLSSTRSYPQWLVSRASRRFSVNSSLSICLPLNQAQHQAQQQHKKLLVLGPLWWLAVDFMINRNFVFACLVRYSACLLFLRFFACACVSFLTVDRPHPCYLTTGLTVRLDGLKNLKLTQQCNTTSLFVLVTPVDINSCQFSLLFLLPCHASWETTRC